MALWVAEMFVRKTVFLVMCLVVVLAAVSCSQVEPAALPTATFEITSTATPDAATANATPVQTSIQFNGSDATIDGDGASAEGANVTITRAGTFTITGSTTAGSITVNAPNQNVDLVLSQATISSTTGPAILFMAAQDPKITLDGTTESSVTGGGEPYDAAVYGTSSYTIDGTGSLYAYGTGSQGILSEVDLTIDGGIVSVEALQDGLRATGTGRNAIRINGGEIYIDCQEDSIDCDGPVTISGGHTFAFGGMQEDGGLKAGGGLTISGGTFLATGKNLTMPYGTGQKYLAYEVAQQQAGANVTINDGSSNILDAEVPTEFTALLYSDPNIKDGVTYSFSIDGLQFAAGTTTGSATPSPSTSSTRPSTSASSSQSAQPSESTLPTIDSEGNPITPAESLEPEPTEGGQDPDYTEPSDGIEPEPEESYIQDGTESYAGSEEYYAQWESETYAAPLEDLYGYAQWTPQAYAETDYYDYAQWSPEAYSEDNYYDYANYAQWTPEISGE